MISWIKVCPACALANPDTAWSCSHCSSDLSMVEARASGNQAPLSPPPPVGEEKAPVAQADVISAGFWACRGCGASNPDYMILCGCGREREASGSAADIQTVPPHQAGGQGGRANQILSLVTGERSFPLQAGDILGREGSVACELFAGFPQVSRRHARIVLDQDGWKLVNLSENLTEVGGVRVPRGGDCPVSEPETVVRLSTRCRVILRLGNPNSSHSP